MFRSEAQITLDSRPPDRQTDRHRMEQGNNAGAPMDMQGGGANPGGGGAPPPFFPMGAGPGGMMMGDAGLADEFMKLQQDFFKWQQQLLQNQHVLHSRVAPLASNPPQLQSVGVIRDILGQTPQGAPNGPPQPQAQPQPQPQPQQLAEAHNPSVGMSMGPGVRRAPVERIINIRFEDGPSETDEAELHAPAFSRTGPIHDLTRDMAGMTAGNQAPRPVPTAAPQPQPHQQPQRRWEEPSVTVGSWRDRPTTQPIQPEPQTYPPMPSPTPITPSQPLPQSLPQQRTSPRPQGPRGFSKPAEGGMQWPPPSNATPAAPSTYAQLPPEQKEQFAQFMQQQQQRQQPTWPPQQQQQQYQPQPLQEQQKQVYLQQNQPQTQPQFQPQPLQEQQKVAYLQQQQSQPQQWQQKQPSPQPLQEQQKQAYLQQQQPSQQQKQPSPQPPQQTWRQKQSSPQPQQQTWPPKQPSPQRTTAQQPSSQPDSTAFWKELENKRQNLGLGDEEGEGAEPARPPRRGSRQDSPPQDSGRPQYYFNGESTAPSTTPASGNVGPRYTSVVTVAADQPQEPGRDKVRSVVQLNAEQPQPQQQRQAPVVRGFRQPNEEVQSRIINQSAGRSRSSVSPPSTTNGENQQGGRTMPTTTAAQRMSPPKSAPQNLQSQGQTHASPPSEIPQAPPAASGPPPPPPPAPPMAPPPPPAPTMPQGERRTASGKKIVTCKGGPELDAREELMMAIRGHGGLKNLRKTHPPV